MSKLERLLKYAEGGMVRKFDLGNKLTILKPSLTPQVPNYAEKYGIDTPTLDKPAGLDMLMPGDLGAQVAKTLSTYSVDNFRKTANTIRSEAGIASDNLQDEETTLAEDQNNQSGNRGISATGKEALKVASTLAVGGIQALDQATMGDKNFSASSKAIDTGVHAATSALMASGNPYAMAAGAALEGINWLTKAGGKTVQGFDVDIKNSGYGNMGHMESESGRIWDNMDRKLQKRNEQVRMALAAADVSQEQEYQQEARANSVTNVLQLNQIALAGGIDTSLLGS